MDWTSLLEREIAHPCFDRPLVCDGYPDLSTAIIIGENPGRNLKRDWWSYWGQSGFDYSRFLSDYVSEKPILGSRLRFCRIRDAGIKAIETNFYRDQGLGGSKRKVSNIRLIQLLIDNNPNLKFAVFHGDKSKLLSRNLKLPRHISVEFPTHFRSISYPEIDALCEKMLTASAVP